VERKRKIDETLDFDHAAAQQATDSLQACGCAASVGVAGHFAAGGWASPGTPQDRGPSGGARNVANGRGTRAAGGLLGGLPAS